MTLRGTCTGLHLKTAGTAIEAIRGPNSLTVIRVGTHSQALAFELAMDERSRIEIDQNGPFALRAR
jgi:hypothetical protein